MRLRTLRRRFVRWHCHYEDVHAMECLDLVWREVPQVFDVLIFVLVIWVSRMIFSCIFDQMSRSIETFFLKKYVKLSINVKGQVLPYKWVPLDCRVDWRAWRDMHNDEYPSDKNLSLERDKCRDAEASQEAPWERLVGFPSLAVLLRQRNWEVREVMSSNDLSLSENVHQLVP